MELALSSNAGYQKSHQCWVPHPWRVLGLRQGWETTNPIRPRPRKNERLLSSPVRLAHLRQSLADTAFEQLCGFRQGNCTQRLTVHQGSAWFAEGELITQNELFLKLF
jgi:hypothetical protein